MNIETKTSYESTISFEAYQHNGELKNYPADIGNWGRNYETVDVISVDSKLKEMKIPAGEYEISITIKRVGDL